MTNSQRSGSTPLIHRLLLWGPLGLGGLLALLVLALGSFPLMSQVQMQGREAAEKQALEQRLPQLRLSLRSRAADQLAAEGQQQQLLALIAGSGDLITFMSQVDREARRHGVQLQLYEPTAAVPKPDADAADPTKGQKAGTRDKLDQEAAAAKAEAERLKNDPLLKAGLKNSQLLLSAKGRFPNLLAFLRSMESLSLLVVQSNLQLMQKLPDQTSTSTAAPVAVPIELKLAISLYQPKTKP